MTPQPPPQTVPNSLAELLRIEGEARGAAREVELLHLMANETRRLLAARQVFVGRRRPHRVWRVAAVSSIAVVDRDAATVRWAEALLARIAGAGKAATLHDVDLPAAATRDQSTGAGDPAYPFRHLLWVPLWSRGALLEAGLLMARETPWADGDRVIAARLGGTFGHAWCLLASVPPLRLRWWRPRRTALLGVAAIVGAGALPVPMTALAPAEIVARDPFVVAMPIDGQIDQVLVEANSRVAAGQPIVRLVDTIPRNKLQIAERETIVAEARLQKAGQLAFGEARGRHDLGIARAELALRSAERDFARETMAQTDIRAPRAGLAVFTDRRDLAGRPMQIGDRILEIADPDAVDLRIELAVADSLVIEAGGRVKVFLDGDPLHPVEARIVAADYRARVAEGKAAAYHVVARLADTTAPPPRIGVRGTAQLFGERVALAFFLLRRPLSALRQWVGL